MLWELTPPAHPPLFFKNLMCFRFPLPHRVIFFAVSVFFAQSTALAVIVSGITVTNTSDPNRVLAVTGRTQEFQSTISSVSSVTTAGLTSSFSSHLSWMLADEVDPNGPGVALIGLYDAGMQIQFTVEDPTHVGYNLSFDGMMRGYLTAVYTPGTSTASTPVSVGQGFFPVRLDQGAGFSLVAGFGVSGMTATATETSPMSNVLVSSSDSHDAGNFVGTKTFGLLFDVSPSPNVSTIMQNGVEGQTSARFGLDPTQGDLELGLYANALDGELAANHGLFIDVNVTALAPSPVPETLGTPYMMLTLAATLMIARRYRS